MTPSLAADAKAALVPRLAEELLGRATADGPVVFEIPIGRTDKVDVIVIWDLFRQLSEEDRSEVIYEAYARCDEARTEGMPLIPRITSAIGVTAQEALEMNLLRYRVSFHGHVKKKDSESIRDAMRAEGLMNAYAAGKKPEAASGLTIYLPTRQIAENALARLQKQFSSLGSWSLGESLSE
jgi:hypothetical protein